MASRCGQCVPCKTGVNCRKCRHCMDKAYCGGSNTLRQKCLYRFCVMEKRGMVFARRAEAVKKPRGEISNINARGSQGIPELTREERAMRWSAMKEAATDIKGKENDPATASNQEHQQTAPMIRMVRPKYDGQISNTAVGTLTDRRGWLDDEVMDRYMTLIERRQEAAGAGSLSVGYMPAQFLPVYESAGYHGVENWTTTRSNPFTMDLYFFPTHVQSHWILVVVRPSDRTLEVYDSEEEHGPHLDLTDTLMGYLKAEAAQRGTSVSGWKVVAFPKVSPKQGTYWDCGICVLTTANLMALGAPLCYNLVHIIKMRRVVLRELQDDSVSLETLAVCSSTGKKRSGQPALDKQAHRKPAPLNVQRKKKCSTLVN